MPPLLTGAKLGGLLVKLLLPLFDRSNLSSCMGVRHFQSEQLYGGHMQKQDISCSPDLFWRSQGGQWSCQTLVPAFAIAHLRSPWRDQCIWLSALKSVVYEWQIMLNLTISVSPSPLGSLLSPVHHQSEKSVSKHLPISSKCNHVDCGRILTWFEPMQSNLKLTRWSERLRWALDRFFAAPTKFFTSLINSFMFWLVLSSSFSWLCRLSLERKLSNMNLGRNGRNSCKTWCIDDIIIVYLK